MKVAAIGEPELLHGYALAGVRVLPVSSAAMAIEAWEQLEPDVGLVLLTPSAHTALGGGLDESGRLWLELPS